MPKGLLGKVQNIDGDGNAHISFEGIEAAQGLLKDNLGNLSVLSQADVMQEGATREARAVPRCSCPLRRRRAGARRLLPCVCFEYTFPLLRIVSADPVRQQYLFPRYTVYAVSRAPGAPKWVYLCYYWSYVCPPHCYHLQHSVCN